MHKILRNVKIVEFKGGYSEFIEELEKLEAPSLTLQTDSDKWQIVYYFFHTIRFLIANYPSLENFDISTLNEQLSNIKVNITVTSQAPIAKGLGSSASYLSTLAASLLSLVKFIFRSAGSEISDKNEDFKSTVNNLAYEFEKIYHFNPSGLDNTSVVHGGLLVYNKQSKRMDQIATEFFKNYDIMLIDSGVPKNTKKNG